MLLGLYESAADEVRVAAFLALRKLAVASDHSLRESVLKVRSLLPFFALCCRSSSLCHFVGSLRHFPRFSTANDRLLPAFADTDEELGFGTVPSAWQGRGRDGLPTHFWLHPYAGDFAEEGSQGGIKGEFLNPGVISQMLTLRPDTQDAYKSVYNWQFVHAVDFWSLVLSSSCEKDRVAQYGESPLAQLLYPLIQVAMGAIR